MHSWDRRIIICRYAMGIHGLTACDNLNRPYYLLDDGQALTALFSYTI